MIARCFIALELGEDAIRACVEAQRLLDGETLRKTATESLHLTIKFLGEVDVDEIAKPIFASLVRGDIDVGVGSLDGFPSIERARVAILACVGDAKLRALATCAEKEAFARGVVRSEHDYHPHITLARSKNDMDLRRIAKRFAPRALGNATRLTLFESTHGKYVQIDSK